VKNKYRNKRIGSYDSKVESAFSKQLKILLPECIIIEKQAIELIPKLKLKNNGITIRAAKVIRDFFIYFREELIAIVDTKGFQTDKSKLQFKLLRYKMHKDGNEVPIFLPTKASERVETINQIKKLITNGKTT